jgi:hypothetical protein
MIQACSAPDISQTGWDVPERLGLIWGRERAIFASDALHNVVHFATGLVALGIGLGMTEKRLARGITWFGILYLVLFVLLLASPTSFGLMEVEVNSADHVLHAALGAVTLAVGLVALRQARSPREPA